ncbi:DUF4249 family protein [Pontibacter sp. G13]|uniref:DUF4249 family protein n=1 Tax=Pontibacter sp. G13 TaxID=3074898 RepID=UPI00288AF5AC|nr:DUF4249 family protein [Pontibacter sp. G13]WNJ21021.1 DUF4249 family protein [Pontibacter sp. G13]
MNRVFAVFSALIALATLQSCSTEFDLNAPPKDIWVVYGTLNPSADYQYIRVSQAFLTEGNALEYAKENDLSAPNLLVTLEGDGKTYTATQVDSVPKTPEDGLFYPYTTLYRFETTGNLALRAGKSYDLTVQQPDNPDFELTAETDIPEEVTLTGLNYTPNSTGRCLRVVEISGLYTLEFTKGRDVPGSAFEIRSWLKLTKNGEPVELSYGPTGSFTDDVRCSESGSVVCYQFRENEILQTFYTDLLPTDNDLIDFGVNEVNRCDDDIDELPIEFWFRVTAMDRNLYLYQLVNSPGFQDLNSVRNQYSNIEGEGDVITLGIFGSISTSERPADLGQCSRYLLKVNETERPTSPCSL